MALSKCPAAAAIRLPEFATPLPAIDKMLQALPPVVAERILVLLKMLPASLPAGAKQLSTLLELLLVSRLASVALLPAFETIFPGYAPTFSAVAHPF